MSALPVCGRYALRVYWQYTDQVYWHYRELRLIDKSLIKNVNLAEL